ncbi:MAG: 2Fe-2S iron-sulfur cluster-binding protein [Gammaproteobacteria bacterium]
MPFEITIEEAGESFPCATGQNVLAAMERLGHRGIPVGCRGGGCGICRVQVLGDGRYRTLKMSRAQVPEVDQARGVCLACKLIPESDLLLKPLGVLRTRIMHDTPAGGAGG